MKGINCIEYEHTGSDCKIPGWGLADMLKGIDPVRVEDLPIDEILTL
jgi:hypothetical protein